MSWQANDAVRKLSKSKGSARMVLLLISNYIGADGKAAFYSMRNLAFDSKLSERALRYIIRGLERLGELRVELGAGPNGCNLYTISLPFDVEKPVKTHASGEPPPGKVCPTPRQQLLPQPPAIAVAPPPGNSLCRPRRDRREEKESDPSPASPSGEPEENPEPKNSGLGKDQEAGRCKPRPEEEPKAAGEITRRLDKLSREKGMSMTADETDARLARLRSQAVEIARAGKLAEVKPGPPQPTRELRPRRRYWGRYRRA